MKLISLAILFTLRGGGMAGQDLMCSGGRPLPMLHPELFRGYSVQSYLRQAFLTVAEGKPLAQAGLHFQCQQKKYLCFVFTEFCFFCFFLPPWKLVFMCVLNFENGFNYLLFISCIFLLLNPQFGGKNNENWASPTYESFVFRLVKPHMLSCVVLDLTYNAFPARNSNDSSTSALQLAFFAQSSQEEIEEIICVTVTHKPSCRQSRSSAGALVVEASWSGVHLILRCCVHLFCPLLWLG